jgi:hypothetical protein
VRGTEGEMRRCTLTVQDCHPLLLQLFSFPCYRMAVPLRKTANKLEARGLAISFKSLCLPRDVNLSASHLLSPDYLFQFRQLSRYTDYGTTDSEGFSGLLYSLQLEFLCFCVCTPSDVLKLDLFPSLAERKKLMICCVP